VAGGEEGNVGRRGDRVRGYRALHRPPPARGRPGRPHSIRGPTRRTTSAVAAAIWYPYKAYPERDVLRWGRRTFEVFETLAAEPKTGVRMREGLELRRERAGEPWWAGAVPGVRRCTEDELPPGYRDGHAFVVPVVRCRLPALFVDRFAALGGTVERRVVAHVDELAGEAALVVNCAGLGARGSWGRLDGADTGPGPARQ
jgi:D-amino-acid oxidase